MNLLQVAAGHKGQYQTMQILFQAKGKKGNQPRVPQSTVKSIFVIRNIKTAKFSFSRTHMHTRTRTLLSLARTCTRARARARARARICTRLSTCARTFIHTRTHTHANTCAHTHTCTQAQAQAQQEKCVSYCYQCICTSLSKSSLLAAEKTFTATSS